MPAYMARSRSEVRRPIADHIFSFGILLYSWSRARILSRSRHRIPLRILSPGAAPRPAVVDSTGGRCCWRDCWRKTLRRDINPATSAAFCAACRSVSVGDVPDEIVDARRRRKWRSDRPRCRARAAASQLHDAKRSRQSDSCSVTPVLATPPCRRRPWRARQVSDAVGRCPNTRDAGADPLSKCSMRHHD
jgi:hypothetical protein